MKAPTFSYTGCAFLFFVILFSFSATGKNRPCIMPERNAVCPEPADSGRVKKKWSQAKKAAVMSACLPGLGQVYNKKYWKVPVIYGLLGTLGYFIYYNNKNYSAYSDALVKRYDSDPGNDTYSQYTPDNLVTLKRSYRRLRDLSILGASLVYVLQVVDANVDGHLANFDVDNISLNIAPWHTAGCSAGGKKYTGLSLTLRF